MLGAFTDAHRHQGEASNKLRSRACVSLRARPQVNTFFLILNDPATTVEDKDLGVNLTALHITVGPFCLRLSAPPSSVLLPTPAAAHRCFELAARPCCEIIFACALPVVGAVLPAWLATCRCLSPSPLLPSPQDSDTGSRPLQRERYDAYDTPISRGDRLSSRGLPAGMQAEQPPPE